MEFKNRIYKTLMAASCYTASLFAEPLMANIFVAIGLTIISYDILVAAIGRLVKQKMLNDDFFMLIISFALFSINRFQESLSVMLIYFFGRIIIESTINKIRLAFFNNINSEIIYANVVENGNVKQVSANSVKVGDIIEVYQYEMIPCDGIIVKGSSKLNTFDLTGEHALISVNAGDKVVNETINTGSTLTIKVTEPLNNSASAKVAKTLSAIVDDSSYAKKMIRYNNIFTASVSLALLAIFLVAYIATGELEHFLMLGLSALIILAPTPISDTIKYSYYASCSKLIKRGVLLKRSNTLDDILEIDSILFDKSSTITDGNLQIVETYSEVLSDEELIKLIATCEEKSNHEILKPIKKLHPLTSESTTNFRQYSGGIKVNLDNDQYTLGKLSFMEDNNIVVKKAKTIGSVIYVAKNKKFIGYVVLRDEIKENVRDNIKNLAKLGINDLIVLSSDNYDYVESLCRKLEISRFLPDISEKDKLSYIDNAQKEGVKLMLIGDGKKDASLLKKASLGVAIGHMGKFLDLSQCDIIILNNDLDHIELSIRAAKDNRKTISLNLSLAILFKTVLVLMLALGIFDLGIGIFTNIAIYLISLLTAYSLMKEKKD